MSEITVLVKLDVGISIELPTVGFLIVALPMFSAIILILPPTESNIMV